VIVVAGDIFDFPENPRRSSLAFGKQTSGGLGSGRLDRAVEFPLSVQLAGEIYLRFAHRAAAAFGSYQAGPTKGLFRQKNGYCGLLADNIAIEMWCRSSMSLTQKVAFIFRQLIDGTPERR